MEIENLQQETDREKILRLLAETIDTVHERIDNYEVDSPDDEELLIKWTRVLGYLSGQYRQLLGDSDLDELQDDVDLLQVARELNKEDR